MNIPRTLEPILRKYLTVPEIIAVVGPRQAGKTTLLTKIQSELKNSIFITFEDTQELQLFEQDIKTFALKYQNYDYLFIDEFQYARHGGKNLKYLFDTKKWKIFISGSSAIDLTIHAIKYLVGRVFVFHLYQLDFAEFLQYRNPDLQNVFASLKNKISLSEGKYKSLPVNENINKDLYKYLHEFMLYGAYPRVIIAQGTEEKQQVLKNIYNTYFLRDIKDLLGVIDDYKLTKLFKALAIHIGQLTNYNELSAVTEYNFLDLKKYLNLLEKTFIVHGLKPFFTNAKTELVKNPKFYFWDTGLRNYVINDFNDIDNRVDKGFLYENFICTQLIKHDQSINFWRTKSGAEVDFILNKKDVYIPVESKSGFDKGVSKSLASFIEKYKSPYGVILKSDSSYDIQKTNDKDISHLPHWIL